VSLILRPLTEADRDRVVEISSRIWDDDWIPDAYAEWIGDARSGESIAAVLDGRVIGFARRTWIHPGHAWFEGIRSDPQCRGHGVGRALTDHLIAGARRDGAERIHLSTYVDNEASIHIIEDRGFERVASFCHLEGAPSPAETVDRDEDIVSVDEAETACFVGQSAFLRLAHGRFPRGWRFFPFDVAPLAAIARLETRLGLHRDGEVAALACVRQPAGGVGPVTLNIADGAPDDVRRLMREIHRRYAGRRIETMVPKAGDQEAVLLPILREFGYTTWDDYAAAVFVYELALG